MVVKSTNGDSITIDGFTFDDAVANNINVNGTLTSASTVIKTTLEIAGDYSASAYVDNITALANVTIAGMTKGTDTLQLGGMIQPKTYHRTAGSNDLFIDGIVDVTLADYFADLTGDLTVAQ